MNAPALFMALFNGAWQGALLCLAAYGLLNSFRRLNAATRYAVWSALLAISLLLPVANYAFSVQPVTHVVTVAARPAAAVRTDRLSSPSLSSLVNRSGNDRRSSRPAAPRPSLTPSLTQAPTLYERATFAATKIAAYAKFALYVLLLIAFVRLALLGREIARMIGARRGVRLIQPPFELRDSVRRPYAFAASPGFAMPCVLGFQPALIVIPQALLAADNEKELLSVVLHEHEHVMRFDDVQNVLHRLAGALGFFMPGVWIALRELAIYREQICDDAAIAGAGNRYAYARTLSALAGWIDASPVPVPCFIFKRKQLLRRIEVLLDAAVSHSLRPNLRFVVTSVAALALVAALVLRFQVPVFAERIAVVAPPKPAVPAKLPRTATLVRPALPKRVTIVKVKVIKPVKPAKPPKLAKTMTRKITETHVIHNGKSERRVITTITVDTRLPGFPRLPRLAPEAPMSRPMLRAAAALSAAGTALTTVTQTIAPPALPARPRPWIIENAVIAATPRVLRSGDLLDALAQNGYRNLSVDDLIALRDHGVSGLLISGATSFFGHPSVADLVRLADHGVRGSYLAELRSAGVTGLGTDDVIRLQDHGVSPMLIAGLRSRGYALNAEMLVKLADHGVTIMYIDSLQRLRSISRPTLDDLIRLHDAGFKP